MPASNPNIHEAIAKRITNNAMLELRASAKPGQQLVQLYDQDELQKRNVSPVHDRVVNERKKAEELCFDPLAGMPDGFLYEDVTLGKLDVC